MGQRFSCRACFFVLTGDIAVDGASAAFEADFVSKSVNLGESANRSKSTAICKKTLTDGSGRIYRPFAMSLGYSCSV